MDGTKVFHNLSLLHSKEKGLVRYMVQDEGVRVNGDFSVSFNPFDGIFGKVFDPDEGGTHTIGEFAIGELRFESSYNNHHIGYFRDNDGRFELTSEAQEIIDKTIEIWNSLYYREVRNE